MDINTQSQILSKYVMFIFSCTLFFNSGIAQSNSLFYLGLFDTNNTSLLGKYDVEQSSLTTLQSPFNAFDYLEFSPDGVLYGVDWAALYVVDPVTGAATNEVVLNDGELAIVCCGLTFKPDGTMLVHEYAYRNEAWMHTLYSGDPATGTLTSIANITGVTGLYGIEYANGVLYGAYDNALYSIDVTTGVATLIGTGGSAWDLTFGTDNLMRASGPNNGAVYTLDLTAGSATLIKNFQTDESKEAIGLTVVCSPIITTQPLSQMVYAGDTVTFSIVAEGTSVLSYQWQKQDDENAWVDIEEATTSQYVLDPFATTDAGGYRCVVTNLAGNVISNRVTLNAGDANQDGRVDVADLGILAAHYGMTSGATWTEGDFNGNGAVDVADLGILSAHYGFGVE